MKSKSSALGQTESVEGDSALIGTAWEAFLLSLESHSVL